jgi:hypothetical protein
MEGRDASDRIKLIKAKASFFAQKTTLAKVQTTADCLTNDGCTPGTCKLTFKTFDDKYNFFRGKNACNGCTCPVSGPGK